MVQDAFHQQYQCDDEDDVYDEVEDKDHDDQEDKDEDEGSPSLSSKVTPNGGEQSKGISPKMPETFRFRNYSLIIVICPGL